jgi:hypothetical protein
VGGSFTVIGQGVNTDPAAKLGVGPVESATILTRTPTSLFAVAPDVGADLGRSVGIALKPTSGAAIVVPTALVVLGPVPVLDGLDRSSAAVGDKVTAIGGWTQTDGERLMILLDSGVAVWPEPTGERAATFVVPKLSNLDPPRAVPVKVKLLGQESNAVTLTVSAEQSRGTTADHLDGTHMAGSIGVALEGTI